MEKFYKITSEKFKNEVKRYREMRSKQVEFVNRFFEENNIDGNGYYIRGNGMCNCEFDEYQKEYISLEILPTENNISRYGKELRKYGVCQDLRAFRKTSRLLKKFQDECVENHIVINLLRIRIGNYFKELRFGGFSTNGLHEYEDAYYLNIRTDTHDSITPVYDGFEEIKGSDYYTTVEQIRESEK